MPRNQSWSKLKKECQYYQRRRPERSELYQVVSSYQDQLENMWGELFESEYGYLRREVSRVLNEYLNCGLLEHGAARVYCDSCKIIKTPQKTSNFFQN